MADNPRLEKTKTPGVFKKGNRYIVVWRHRGKQHKSSHRTYAEAREAKGQRQAGDRRPSIKQPLAEYANGWLDGYQGRTSRGLDDDTRQGYRRSLELHAIPFFEGYRVCDIEQPDIRKYVAHLQAKNLTAGTVRRYVAPIKAMFATAVEDGDLPVNPTTGVRINSRRASEPAEEQAKAMTRAELARMLAAVPERWRLHFELLAQTGLRISELLGLDWEDVEFGAKPRLRIHQQFYRGKLKAHAKSDAGTRMIPLSPGMARALWSARPAAAAISAGGKRVADDTKAAQSQSQRPTKAGAIFTTRTGERLNDRNLRRVLDKAADEAGVPWVGFHTFRHTCASILLDSGKNIRQVSAWLGHEDPAFTLKTYTHLMDAGLGDADCFDALFPSYGPSTASHGSSTASRGESAEGNKRATADPAAAANG
jgi:integrase